MLPELLCNPVHIIPCDFQIGRSAPEAQVVESAEYPTRLPYPNHLLCKFGVEHPTASLAAFAADLAKVSGDFGRHFSHAYESTIIGL